MNFDDIDKYCFYWSILDHFRPFESSQPERESTYVRNFKELDIKRFDFSNEFKRSGVIKTEGLHTLSINIFELNFFQIENGRKHELSPFEISKNGSNRADDLMIHRNRLVLI